MDNKFYYKKDRLNQLRGFINTVQSDCCSLKACEKMGLEATTVSKQIRSLERDLGIKLFDRSKSRRLTLTEDGKMFYQRVVPLVQSVESTFDDFRKDLEIERKNTLRIASFDVILEKMIPYIAEFKRKNPNVEIFIFSISKEEALAKLILGELDLVFYPCDINEEKPLELEKIKISNYANYWILYPGHPLAEKDEKDITREHIASYPFCILLKKYIYNSSLLHFLDEYKPKSLINIEGGSAKLLIEMVKCKIGITIMNDIHLTNDDKTKLVLKNTIYTMPQMFYYCFQNKKTSSKIIVEFFLNIIIKNHEKIFH